MPHPSSPTPARPGHPRRSAPHDWLELSITVPAELVEPAVRLFHRYGRSRIAVEEEGSDPDNGGVPTLTHTVRAYLPRTASLGRDREMIRMGLDLLALIHPLPPIQERSLRHNEWEEQWKAHFTPLRIGRLVLKPTWRQVDTGPDAVLVDLDPGMAFGTGHHPTTHACLQAVERLVSPGTDVLDVGTGSGILAIAAARLGARHIVGLDTDPVALRVARANARLNGVGRRTRFHQGSLPHPHIDDTAFHLVLANIHARALAHMAPQFPSTLRPGGWLVASGILAAQQAEVEAAFRAVGLTVRERVLREDWVTLLIQHASRWAT